MCNFYLMVNHHFILPTDIRNGYDAQDQVIIALSMFPAVTLFIFCHLLCDMRDSGEVCLDWLFTFICKYVTVLCSRHVYVVSVTVVECDFGEGGVLLVCVTEKEKITEHVDHVAFTFQKSPPASQTCGRKHKSCGICAASSAPTCGSITEEAASAALCTDCRSTVCTATY